MHMRCCEMQVHICMQMKLSLGPYVEKGRVHEPLLVDLSPGYVYTVLFMCMLFEGVCSKLTSSWPPARVERDGGMRPCRHFAGDCRGNRGPGDIHTRPLYLCKLRT